MIGLRPNGVRLRFAGLIGRHCGVNETTPWLPSCLDTVYGAGRISGPSKLKIYGEEHWLIADRIGKRAHIRTVQDLAG